MAETARIIFSKIDFISQDFNFEYKDSRNYRTIQGAIFSLIAFTTSLVLAIMFGREVYQRKNPIVTTSEVIVHEPKIFLHDFPLAITLFDEFGMWYTFDDYLDYEVELYKVDENKMVTPETNYTLVKCNELKYSRDYDELKILQNSAYPAKCVNFSDSTMVKNPLGLPNSSVMSVKLYYCNPNSEQRKTKCKVDNNFNNLNHIFVIEYFNSLVNSFYQNNPVSFFLDNVVVYSTTNVIKNIAIYAINSEYESDEGWMISEYKKYNYLSVRRISNDISFVADTSLERKLAVILHLRTESIGSKISRNYLKVQELFAKIGGIANAILILIKFFTFPYLRFLYLKFIRDETFGFIETDNIDKERSFKNVKVFKEIFPNIKVNDSKDDLSSKLKIEPDKSEVKFQNVNNNNENTSKVLNRINVNNVTLNKNFTNKVEVAENSNIGLVMNNYVHDNNQCHEIGSIKELQKNKMEKISFYTYFLYKYFPCMLKSNIQSKLSIEMKRIEFLLDVRNLYNYLVKAYFDNFEFYFKNTGGK